MAKNTFGLMARIECSALVVEDGKCKVRERLAEDRIHSYAHSRAGRGSRTKDVVALQQFRLRGPDILKMAGRMPDRVALSVL